MNSAAEQVRDLAGQVGVVTGILDELRKEDQDLNANS